MQPEDYIRSSRRPRSQPPPQSPGNERIEVAERPATPAGVRVERHVHWSLLPWTLTRLELRPPRLTRPPRHLLTTWDVRIRRYTSPRETWVVPPLISPLHASPTPPTSTATQTAAPARVHRGTQARVVVRSVDQATQSDSDWEPPLTSAATQTETPGPDPPELRSHTPPGLPPARERARSAPAPTGITARRSRWGPLRRTRTKPSITYRERRSR